MKQQSSQKRKKPAVEQYFVNEERASVAVPLSSAIMSAKNQQSPKLKDHRSFDAKLDALLMPAA